MRITATTPSATGQTQAQQLKQVAKVIAKTATSPTRSRSSRKKSDGPRREKNSRPARPKQLQKAAGVVHASGTTKSCANHSASPSATPTGSPYATEKRTGSARSPTSGVHPPNTSRTIGHQMTISGRNRTSAANTSSSSKPK